MSKHKTYNKIFSIYGSGKVFKYSLERGAVDYPTLISKAYEDRVIADGGVVESLGCFTAFATALRAYQPPIALAATGIGEISFTANWKPFKGAKYYLLDVSTSPTFATFVYENEIVPAPTTSYVVIGLNSNTTYYYRVRASTTFDADYQAVLDYATTQGYTLPSSGQQVLQNQLVVDLKAGGIWSKLDTFAVFATDGSSDFALIDWIRLSDYTAVNSPTFTTNVGFNSNGTSSYINVNYNPSTSGVNYLLDDACFGTGGDLLVTSNLLGTNLPRSNMRSTPSNFNGINSGNSIGNILAFTSQTAVKWHDRNSSSDYRRMQNDVELETVAQVSSQLPTLFEVMRYAFGYATINDKFAYFFAGASLYNERTNFSNALNSYMASI